MVKKVYKKENRIATKLFCFSISEVLFNDVVSYISEIFTVHAFVFQVLETVLTPNAFDMTHFFKCAIKHATVSDCYSFPGIKLDLSRPNYIGELGKI